MKKGATGFYSRNDGGLRLSLSAGHVAKTISPRPTFCFSQKEFVFLFFSKIKKH